MFESTAKQYKYSEFSEIMEKVASTHSNFPIPTLQTNHNKMFD